MGKKLRAFDKYSLQFPPRCLGGPKRLPAAAFARQAAIYAILTQHSNQDPTRFFNICGRINASNQVCMRLNLRHIFIVHTGVDYAATLGFAV